METVCMLQKERAQGKKPRAVANDCIEIAKEFMEAHKGVILFVDILCADGVTFLLTPSENRRPITIWHIKDRKEASLLVVPGSCR